MLEPGRRLDRRAVADPARRAVVTADVGRVRDVLRPLRDGLRVLRDIEVRPERGRDALVEVEVEVPGLEVLLDVRQVHVRAVAEVVAAPEVDVAERLEVRDLPGAHAGALGRRETEEELGGVRDQGRARDAGGDGELLRQRLAAVEAAAREAAADRRDLEELRVTQPLLGVVDVRVRVGAEEDRDVVRLEPRRRRVAREAVGVEDHGTARASVVRQQPAGRVRHEPAEVRQPPCHGHAEAGGRGHVVGVEAVEGVRELLLGIRQPGPVGREPRGEDRVVERRHEHLDVVRLDDADAVEQMLLRQRDDDGRPLRRARGQTVDELVDPGRADGTRGGACEHLLPGEPHRYVAGVGRTSTRERSSWWRYRTTCWYVSGGATCSDSV